MGLTFPKKLLQEGNFHEKYSLVAQIQHFGGTQTGVHTMGFFSPTILFTLLQIRTFVQNLEKKIAVFRAFYKVLKDNLKQL